MGSSGVSSISLGYIEVLGESGGGRRFLRKTLSIANIFNSFLCSLAFLGEKSCSSYGFLGWCGSAFIIRGCE